RAGSSGTAASRPPRFRGLRGGARPGGGCPAARRIAPAAPAGAVCAGEAVAQVEAALDRLAPQRPRATMRAEWTRRELNPEAGLLGPAPNPASPVGGPSVAPCPSVVALCQPSAVTVTLMLDRQELQSAPTHRRLLSAV